MKQYKYFIFDLDGTLVDSSPSIYSSLHHLEQVAGIPPMAADKMHRFVGPPLAESFINFYGATPEQVPEWLAIYRDDYKGRSYLMTENYEGVAELLAHIKSHGGYSAVATLKNRIAAEPTLEHSGLSQYLDYVAALEDNKKSSKADLIRECLAHYGNPPLDEVIFFGDSPYDGVGAQEAGVDFVALVYGFGFLEEGSLDGIDFVYKATAPLDLLSFVQKSITGA